MKALSFLLFLGFANGVFAQQITTAKIKDVKQNGLHKMIIPSEIRSFAKENLSDFRILDANKNEVPYALLNNANVASEVVHFDYKKLKIISKETIPNTSSTVTIENTIQNLDLLTLTITNTKIEKSYSISGSNDLKNWYGLCQNEKLEYEKTNVAIPVPVTSYHYIKIVFNDKKSLPINIEEVGFSKIIPQKYTTEKIAPKKINIKQIPTEKKTQIEVDFDHPNRINQLSFTISSPTLYNRNAQIFALKSQKINHKVVQTKEILFQFELNSDNKTDYEIPYLNEKKFFIEIENQDNPPLQFSTINCNQNSLYVVADLKPNQEYTIVAGDPKYKLPNYDLAHFTDKHLINNNLPEVKITQIKHENHKTQTAIAKPFWQQSWFMWLCIGIGGLTILLFSNSLLKDLKNNS